MTYLSQRLNASRVLVLSGSTTSMGGLTVTRPFDAVNGACPLSSAYRASRLSIARGGATAPP